MDRQNFPKIKLKSSDLVQSVVKGHVGSPAVLRLLSVISGLGGRSVGGWLQRKIFQYSPLARILHMPRSSVRADAQYRYGATSTARAWTGSHQLGQPIQVLHLNNWRNHMCGGGGRQTRRWSMKRSSPLRRMRTRSWRQSNVLRIHSKGSAFSVAQRLLRITTGHASICASRQSWISRGTVDASSRQMCGFSEVRLKHQCLGLTYYGRE